MPANLEAPKPLNSLLFALFAWLNCIHARGQIMLLFAYGSHACPYGDWSKEEKLTYVGGLFSCSLQVNFSSNLSVFQVTSPAISGTGNVSNNRSTSCADPSELHLTAPEQRRKKQKNIHLQSFQQTSIMETAEYFLLDPYNRHIPVSPRSGCSEVKSILLFTARTAGTGLHMFRSDLTHQTTTACAARFQQLQADAFSARAAPVH